MPILRLQILSCLLTLLLPNPLWSQGLFESQESADSGPENPTWGGFIRTAAYLGLTPREEDAYLQSVYAQAGLKVRARAARVARAHADLRFRWGNEWQHSLSEIDLREAYLDVDAGPGNFRVGKSISPWGKGSVFNPTDILSPLDPTRRSPDPDDMKLGSWNIQGKLALGSHIEIGAIWRPVYEASVLLIDPVPLPEYVEFLDPDYPGLVLRESSYGLNLDLHFSLMDLSVYGFKGFRPWTGIAYHSLEFSSAQMEPEALRLYEKAYSVYLAGADFSLPVGSLLFRAEGAWSRAADWPGSGNGDIPEYLPFPELAYTAELEYGFAGISLLTGYYGKYIIDHVENTTKPSLSANTSQLAALVQEGIPISPELLDQSSRAQLSAFNRLYNYQLDECYHSIFLVIKGSLLHDALEFELPLIFHSSTREWTLQPSLSWLPADGIRIKAGFGGMYGPPDSLYDLVGPVLNASYLALTLSF